MGRPRLADDVRIVGVIRVGVRQHELDKYHDLGGEIWLRQAIQEADVDAWRRRWKEEAESVGREAGNGY